jgi:hypothetical protein
MADLMLGNLTHPHLLFGNLPRPAKSLKFRDLFVRRTANLWLEELATALNDGNDCITTFKLKSRFGPGKRSTPLSSCQSRIPSQVASGRSRLACLGYWNWLLENPHFGVFSNDFPRTGIPASLIHKNPLTCR